MKKTWSFAVLVGAFFGAIAFSICGSASAQTPAAPISQQRQYYVQTPAPAPAPAAPAAQSGVSCCQNSPTGQCTPACAKGRNNPEVSSKCPPGTEKCTDIEVIINGTIETVQIDEKFYVDCKPGKAKVPVPVLEVKTTERCEFKKHTYRIDCCDITVCVPCRRCITEKKVCTTKESPTPHSLRICTRRDGTVDVYVLDVPGMPKEWLLYMEAKIEDVKNGLKDLEM